MIYFPIPFRYVFEIITVLESAVYLFVQQLGEIMNTGLASFLKQLVSFQMVQTEDVDSKDRL